MSFSLQNPYPKKLYRLPQTIVLPLGAGAQYQLVQYVLPAAFFAPGTKITAWFQFSQLTLGDSFYLALHVGTSPTNQFNNPTMMLVGTANAVGVYGVQVNLYRSDNSDGFVEQIIGQTGGNTIQPTAIAFGGNIDQMPLYFTLYVQQNIAAANCVLSFFNLDQG